MSRPCSPATAPTGAFPVAQAGLVVALFLVVLALGGSRGEAQALPLAAGPSQCPNALLAIPSEGQMGWPFHYPCTPDPTKCICPGGVHQRPFRESTFRWLAVGEE